MADDSDDGQKGDGPEWGGPDGDPGNLIRGPWWGPDECPSVLIFAAYLDGRLPESQHSRVLDHLSACAKCRHDRTVAMALLLEIGALDDDSTLDEPIADDDGALDRALKEEARRLLTGLAAIRPRRGGRAAADEPAEEVAPVAEEAVAAVAAAEEAAAKPAARRRTVATALAAAGVAAILVGSGFVVGSRSSRDAGRPAPSLYSPRERPFAARFTGKHPWAPASGKRGSADSQLYLPPESMTFLAAAERRGRPPEASSASLLGKTGAMQVLAGRVEPGAETLRRASAAQPGSAELLSDLGAALLARAEVSERNDDRGSGGAAAGEHDADYAAALEAVERALEISPHLQEALFNRALALERLYLWRSARHAWQTYLNVDGASSWAAEARRRLAAIVIPARPDAKALRSELVAVAAGGEHERLAELVQTYRQLARRTVQEELLPGWGSAALAGDEMEADRQLTAAAAIAEEWAAQTSDGTLREAVLEAEKATGIVRRRLAAGYSALGDASRALDAFDLDIARAAADRSLVVLSGTTPASNWAALVRLACIAYRGGEVEGEALHLVKAAPTDLSSVARAYWITGLWNANHGRHEAAIAGLRRSREVYERLEEIDSAIWLELLIGDAYRQMGATAVGWNWHRHVLAYTPSLVNSQRAVSILVQTAMSALYEGQPRVAIHHLDEALAEPNFDQPDLIAQACLLRSRVLHELRRDAEARQTLQRAAAWLSRGEPTKRRFLNGELDLSAGLLESDPEKAVARIARALTWFRQVGPPWRVPSVYLELARARLRAGDATAADADLRSGLALLEQEGALGVAATAWRRRLDGPEQLFDERIKLALQADQSEEAFGIAEASRARGLRPRATSRNTAHLIGASDTSEIRALLEPGTTLLFFAVIRESAVVWRLRHDSLLLVRLRIRPAELAQLVAAFNADIQVGAWTATTREVATRLYTALLEPTALGPGRLVIVPDDALHGLPFAALTDRSGRFVVEDHELTVAPSASVFLNGQAHWREQREPPEDALIVGDPRVDPKLFPWIRPLEGARQEAREVAVLYPRRELLVGGAATRAAVLDSLGKRTVVHFSGHAIANSVDPAQSSLPLADDQDGTNGLLTAADIARLRLTATRTIVLSGCETGVGQDGGSEGSLSLARAFLAAGVPNVVASLWPITDVPSAPLMTAFHRRLREGDRPAAALRAAQLALLRGHEPSLRSPSVWAAFEAFGG